MTLTLSLFSLSPVEIIALFVLFVVSKLLVKKSRQIKSSGNESDIWIGDLIGPPTLPFLGNTLSFFTHGRSQVHLLIDSWAKTYGDCFRVHIPGTHLVVSDVHCIKSVLKRRPGTFSRSPKVCEVFDRMNSGGLLTSSGDRWKRFRRITAPHLSLPNVKKMVEQVSFMATKLVAKWETSSACGKDIGWLDDCGLYALDVGCVVVSGCDMSTLAGSQLGKDVEILKRFIADWLRQPFKFLFHEANEFKEARVRFDNTVRSLVVKYEKEADLPDFSLNNNCLLGHIVQQLKSGDSLRMLTSAEILENTKIYILAGADTVEATLGWVLYYVATSSITQEKVYEEAKMCVGSSISDDTSEHCSKITWDKVFAMKYLNAVVLEAIRLHHLAPIQVYIAEKDTEVGNVKLCKGEKVLLNLKKSSLSEDNFTHAKEFWPDRWLIAEGLAESPKDVNFVHADIVGNFGYGPRNCPGQHLAMVEIKVFIAMLVLRNSVELADSKYLVEEELSVTVKPKNLKLKLQHRKNIS